MKPRVLVFEDNAIIRSALEYILKEKDYEVFTYSDPKMCHIYHSASHDCLSAYSCADIIISDVNMPTKTGIELFRELRQKRCKVKFWALMSADWTESNLRYAQELGCHIFHKPFSMEKMLGWLNDCRKKIDPERRLHDWLIKP